METLLVGETSAQADVLKQTTNVLADITRKAGDGTFTLRELKLFALRQNPFASARLSKRVREEWERFYSDYFGFDVHLGNLVVPDDPGEFSRILVIADGLTLDHVVRACQRHFEVRTYHENLDAALKPELRKATEHYTVRVRDQVEADGPWTLHSQNPEISITLLERLVYELKYYSERKSHLDRKHRTICWGSRFHDASVPVVWWEQHDKKLYIRWLSADDEVYRSRSVIS